MKTKILVLVFGTVLFIISSCSIEKRHYTSGYNIEWNSRKYSANASANHEVAKKINDQKNEEAVEIGTNNKHEHNVSASISATDPIILPNENMVENAVEDCDNITLKNGQEIKAKITEVTGTEIKYRKCEDLSGPVLIVKKSDVLFIKYINGVKEIIPQEPNPTANSKPAGNDERELEGFGIAGFICALLGIFIAAIPLGILAVIFAIISIGRLNAHPKKLKGWGFAFIAIFLGLADIILVVIFLASMGA